MKKLLCLLPLIALLAGCTENVRSKHWGGTMTVNIPSENKFVNATYKDAALWYLYRPMRTNETPETWTFKEKSSLGMLEGTVIFVEAK